MMVTLYDIDALQKRNAELEAENERLRKALEAVEFVAPDFYAYCPWCHAMIYDSMGHKPDCPRQLALGLTEVEK